MEFLVSGLENDESIDQQENIINLFDYNNVENVKAALDSGIDVNTKNGDGDTALSRAINNDEPKIVELLLEQPYLNLNETNRYNATPIEEASINARLYATEGILNYNKGESRPSIEKLRLALHETTISIQYRFGNNPQAREIDLPKIKTLLIGRIRDLNPESANLLEQFIKPQINEHTFGEIIEWLNLKEKGQPGGKRKNRSKKQKTTKKKKGRKCKNKSKRNNDKKKKQR